MQTVIKWHYNDYIISVCREVRTCLMAETLHRQIGKASYVKYFLGFHVRKNEMHRLISELNFSLRGNGRNKILKSRVYGVPHHQSCKKKLEPCSESATRGDVTSSRRQITWYGPTSSAVNICLDTRHAPTLKSINIVTGRTSLVVLLCIYDYYI